MNRLIKIIIVVLISATCIKAQTNDKKIALVIGNSNYRAGQTLKNPVNDANLMAKTLTSLGFEVILKIDANKGAIEQAVYEFSKKLPEYKVSLFYYAGHGIQVDGVNYLLPVDAELNDKGDAKFQAVSVNYVVEELEKYPDNTNIVILDACRNNPFRSFQRGGSEGFKAIMPASGTIIAFATSEGSTAADGQGDNGLFTEVLSKQMLVPQRIEDVFINTRNDVEKISNGAQSPQEWTKLKGKFSFREETSNVSNNNINNLVEIGNAEDIPTFGDIELISEISGTLFIDGKSFGDISANTKVPINKITSGKHKLEIRGRELWTKSIVITKDQTTSIKAESANKPVNQVTSTTANNSPNSNNSLDEQSLKPIKINNQTWMGKNLNIPTPSGSWCYNKSTSNCDKYGRLYDWETAKTVCPLGWHLPSDEEWNTLIEYLGGEDEAGGRLKSVINWDKPNTGAINSTDFSAIAGGSRSGDGGTFESIGRYGAWWSSTEGNSSFAYARKMGCSNSSVYRDGIGKTTGFSVRCIKD